MDGSQIGDALSQGKVIGDYHGGDFGARGPILAEGLDNGSVGALPVASSGEVDREVWFGGLHPRCASIKHDQRTP